MSREAWRITTLPWDPEQQARPEPPRRIRAVPSPAETHPYRVAALLLWPRLDRTRLRRCGDNPGRIASLVAERTAAPVDCLVGMLERAAADVLWRAAVPVGGHRAPVVLPRVMDVPATAWPPVREAGEGQATPPPRDPVAA